MINAGAGLDTFGNIDLTQIGAAGLTINAGGDGESLTANTTTAGTVSISSTQIQRSGNGAITYSGLSSLTVNGTAGVDTFNIASTAASTQTTINAGTGLDTFGNIDLTQIGSAGLTINAGGDGESLTANTTTAGTFTISATQVQRTGNGAMTYNGLSNLIVNGSMSADTINILSTAAGTATNVLAGGGVDSIAAIDLTTIGAAGLIVNGGGNGEILTLGTSVAGTINISSTQIQYTGNGAVGFASVSGIVVNGTSGIDTFNIASSPSIATTINAGAGLDLFSAIDLTTIGAGSLTINAGGDGESLATNLTTAGIATISSTSLQRTGNGIVNYSGLASLVVNGTAGVDTFNVNSTAAGTATTINAGGSTDSFGPLNLTTIGAAGLTINAGANGESLIANPTTTGTVSVSSTQVQRTGNGAVTYSGLANLTINGTTGADTFNVASTAAGTATTINAGNGVDVFGAIDLTQIGAAGLVLNAGPEAGQSLTLNTTTAGTVAVSGTQVQRSGNGAVAYSGLSTLVVNGTANVDTFNVSGTAAGTATTINAGTGLDVFGIISLSSINTPGLTVNGGGDGESLTLSAAASSTVAISSTQVQRTSSGPIAYTGLASLIINGTTSSDTFNVASTAANTATTINGSPTGDTYGAIDLTTIGAAGLTINAAGSGQSLTLNTSIAGTVAVSSTQVQRSGNGTVAYAGLATLTVNGTAGVDTFNIASTAAGTQTTVNAGTGLDVFGAIDLTTIGAAGLTISAGGDGESLTANTTTAGTVTLTGTQLQRTGNGAITYSGLSSLIVNGTSGVDTFNVASTAAGTATTINAGAGLDVFAAIDLTTIGAAGLTINAGGDGESLTANTTTAGTVSISSTQIQRSGNGAITYSGLVNLIVNGTSGVDTFNIASTAAGTQTTVNANTGLDIFGNIDLTQIGAAGLVLNAGGDGESLTANTTTAGTITLSSTQLQRTGNGAIIYSGLSNLIVNGTSGVDTFNIASTAAGTQTTINAASGLDVFAAITLTQIGAAGLSINAGGDGESLTLNTTTVGTVNISGTQVQRVGNGAVSYTGLGTLIVNGTTSADTFNIASTAAGTATTVNAGLGTDTFGAIDLATIGAAGLTLNAGGNGESLVLNSSATGTFNVDSAKVQLVGNGPVNYTGLSTLTVNGTASADTINIASTAAGTATTVNSGLGTDIFGAIDLTTIGAAGLTVNAGGDNESLTLNTTTAGTVNISSAAVQRVGNGVVNYTGLGTLIVYGTSGADTFNITSTSPSTSTTINAGSGIDSINADLSALGGATTTINAGGDGDTLTLNTTLAGTVTISSTQVQRLGNGPIVYSGVGDLIVNGTSSSDTFQILSTATATATTVNAAGGLDLFSSINLATIGAAGLTVNAGGDGESLTTGIGTAGTVTLSSTQIQRTGNGPLTYSGFANLTVADTPGVDTFIVTSTADTTATTIQPSGTDIIQPIDLTTIGAAGLTINVSGPGIPLTLNTSVAGTVSVSSTQVQHSGNGAITYSGLSSLTVNGTSGIDTFNIASTADATLTTINSGAGLDVFAPIDLTTIGAAGLVLNAGGDGESLTANTTTAGTVSLSSTQLQRTGNGPITYSGLANLTINGTTLSDTFNIASTAANTLTTINAGTGLDVFAPIDLTTIGAAGLILNAGGDGESLTTNTTTAGTVSLTSTQLQRTGNGPITYSGLANLTINGTAGIDTFNIASTAANMLTTINAGAGLDLFAPIDLTTIGAAGLILNAGGDGESLTANTTTAGTITLSSTQLQRTGNGPITYSGLANLTINGTAGIDTFNIASTAANTLTTIIAGAGLDIFAPIDLTTIGAAGLVLNAGGDGESLTTNTTTAGTVNLSSTQIQRTGNGPITYSGLANLIINGTSGVDTFIVTSTAAGTSTMIDGANSGDTYTVTQNAMAGPLNIADSGASGTDQLTSQSTSLVGETIGVTATQITRNDGATITYSGIETLIVNGTGVADTINITSTTATTATTINAGAGSDTINLLGNAAGGSVILHGGADNDILNIQSVATGSTVQVFGDTENDTVNVSSDAPTNMGVLSTIVGNLSIDTGTGVDTIILSDCGETTTANSGVVITNSAVSGFAGPTNTNSIQYQYEGTLTLELIGSNTLNDHFEVELTAYPAAPTLTLQFDGKGQPAGGMDTLRIDGTGNDDTIKVGTFGSSDPYQIQNIECLQLFGGVGDDTLQNDTNVSSLIDGGDGDDLLVGGSNVDVIFGGDGVDTIYGRSGGDYLFADHDFNNRSPIVKHAANGDKVFGDAGLFAGDPFATSPGIDNIVAIGSDSISAGGQIGDTIVGAGLTLTVEDWLRARFLNPSSKNIQAIINAALMQPCTMI